MSEYAQIGRIIEDFPDRLAHQSDPSYGSNWWSVTSEGKPDRSHDSKQGAEQASLANNWPKRKQPITGDPKYAANKFRIGAGEIDKINLTLPRANPLVAIDSVFDRDLVGREEEGFGLLREVKDLISFLYKSERTGTGDWNVKRAYELARRMEAFAEKLNPEPQD